MYKIIMFGHKRIPSREGGVEVVVEALATRMARLGNHVTCINRRGHHVSGAQFDAQAQAQHEGVLLTSVPTIDKKGLAALSAAFFASIKAAFSKCDVVHIHAEGSAAFCWLPRLMGKQVVVTCHGLDWARPRWRDSIGGKFIKYGEKVAVRHAHHIIVLSRSVQQYFQDTYGRQTVLIPNGIDRPAPAGSELLAQQYALTPGSYILALARLTDEKNIHLLISAYKQLHTDKKLVIAGGSSDSQEYVDHLHDLAGDDERILFTGFVQGPIIGQLYENAYLYCLPSSLEGMPLSLLEAMSYGCCCLVSSIPECTQVVQDRAAVFEKDSLEALTQQLQMLCDRPDVVAAYRAGAADYICGKYSWDDITDQTLQLYRSSGL